MWNPASPEDFSNFLPTDMPDFLDWWEMQNSNAMALQLSGAFIEGSVFPYLEAIANGERIPAWIQTLLRWRLAAQWTYQVGGPLSQKVMRGLPGLLPFDMPNYPEAFRISPQEIAEIPPQLRQGFLEGAKFSMQWVRRLSGDAREQIKDLLSINTLKNRNAAAAIPLLEQILRRDKIAKKLGIPASEISQEQIDDWLQEAGFEALERLAYRAELISVTESMRMGNLGILTSLEEQGEKLCYVMPHRGSCPECQRLLDGRVFKIEVLKRNLFENFGKKKENWVASLPQHPKCRHSPMETPYQFRSALKRVSVPDVGIVLQWYGLPGGKPAMESLGLEAQDDWLLPAA
jgi:hypothetical protein